MRRLREKLSFANVTALIALCLALTGAGYAASVAIDGRDIKNRTIKGKKLRPNTITGRQVRESRLGRVPRARRADTAATADRATTASTAADASKLNGVTADQLRTRCPGDLIFAAGVCFEPTTRVGQVYELAVLTCDLNGNRRLPSHDELLAFLSRGDVSVASGGELTSSVDRPSSVSAAHPIDVAVITADSGTTEWVNGGGTESPRAFRCVSPKEN